jgi:nucleoside-diphosphate-sugar epimerase
MPPASRELHVIFGTGPLGLATLRCLRAEGHRVRMINRSGRVGFEKDPETELGGGDAADPRLTREVCEGATAVYHCVGLPYPRWSEFPAIMRGIVEGAAAAGAKLVYGDNVYAYGHVTGPIREDLPETATTRKGRIRAEVAGILREAHKTGKVRGAIARASDFFGPGVTEASMLGGRVFERLLAGRSAQVVGNPDRPHSYTYIDDFARALVTLASRDEALGHTWLVPNAPATTTRAIVGRIASLAGVAPKVSALPSFLVGALGLFDAQIRELKEMLYEFEDDFVIDDTRARNTLGLAPTPLDQSLAATLTWWKERASR